MRTASLSTAEIGAAPPGHFRAIHCDRLLLERSASGFAKLLERMLGRVLERVLERVLKSVLESVP